MILHINAQASAKFKEMGPHFNGRGLRSDCGAIKLGFFFGGIVDFDGMALVSKYVASPEGMGDLIL
jgi:hypothetical protein